MYHKIKFIAGTLFLVTTITTLNLFCVDGPGTIGPVFTSDSLMTLTPDNIDSAIALPYNLALIEFFSPTCGACIALSPVIDTLAQTLPKDILVGAINVSSEPEVRSRFTIEWYPTVIFFKSGAEIHRTIGSHNVEFFQNIIDSLTRPEP